jgi:hypothetical protein
MQITESTMENKDTLKNPLYYINNERQDYKIGRVLGADTNGRGEDE